MCENFGESLRKSLRPFHYPKETQVLLLLLVLLFMVNILAMQHSYRFTKVSYFSLVFYTSMNSLLIAVLLILFIIEQQQISTSPTFVIDFFRSLRCQMIAKGTFLLGTFNVFLSMLVYFETYRTLTNLQQRKDCNKQYVLLLLCFMSVLVGTMQTIDKGSPSPLCMILLGKINRVIVLAFKGLMCLIITGLNIALSKHFDETRRATGRKQTRNDRLILARFTIYNLVMIFSLILNCIELMVPIENNAMYIMTLIFQLSLAPFAFPVIFVLSTRPFRQRLRKICN